MSHTPGPWSERSRSNCDASIQGAGGELVADVNLIHESESGEANARLIAAAPELLELLKQFVSDIETNDPIYPAWIDAAKAAIAKAEGK